MTYEFVLESTPKRIIGKYKGVIVQPKCDKNEKKIVSFNIYQEINL